MIKPDVTVHVSGPLFSGAWRGFMRQLMGDIEEVVAEAGVEQVQMQYDRSLRHPTGYHRSRVQHEANRTIDTNAVYGPWLEGIGSRNKTTRFKGYHSFRQATQQLERQVPRLVEPAVRRTVRRLNG